MGRLDSLFLQSPYWVKNVGLTLVGVYKNWQRRSGSYAHYLTACRAAHRLNKTELIRLEKNLLEESYGEAIDSVSAYANYPRIQFSYPYENLELISILEKKDIKLNSPAYLNPNVRISEVTSTTGSTGSPLKIPATMESRKRNYAFFDEFLFEHGASRYSKSITIAGRQVAAPNAKKPPYWAYDAFNKSLYMSAYHLSKSTALSYLKKINKFRPVYMDTYPSVIYELACFAEDLGILMHQPKFICTSSETLSVSQREVIERVFKCPIRNQYGSAEMCIFGYECSHGKMHIRSDYSFVEVVDQKGKRVRDGQIGDLVCTSFLNRAFPLLRYRIGDRGAITNSIDCECGSNFPILLELEGRRDDYLVSASGRKFTRLSPILKVKPLIESQFEQINIDELILRIVPTIHLCEAEMDSITTLVENYLGDEFKVTLEVVESIPRGKGGKFRSVIGLK